MTSANVLNHSSSLFREPLSTCKVDTSHKCGVGPWWPPSSFAPTFQPLTGQRTLIIIWGDTIVAINYPHVRVDSQHLQVPGQKLLGGDEGGEVIPESLEASLLPLEGLGLGYPDRRRVVSPMKLTIDPTVNAVQGHVSILQEFIELKKMCFHWHWNVSQVYLTSRYSVEFLKNFAIGWVLKGDFYIII